MSSEPRPGEPQWIPLHPLAFLPPSLEKHARVAAGLRIGNTWSRSKPGPQQSHPAYRSERKKHIFATGSLCDLRVICYTALSAECVI